MDEARPCTQRKPRQQERNGHAIKADAACFTSHDLVVFAHDAEGDQNGDQRGERRELIGQVRREIDEIVYDNKESDAVAGDIVEELKEGEGLKEKNEHGHQHREKREKAAEQIKIHELWKAAARRRDGLSLDARAVCAPGPAPP